MVCALPPLSSRALTQGRTHCPDPITATPHHLLSAGGNCVLELQLLQACDETNAA